MAKKIKFVEWKPKAILESELPSGVRYKPSWRSPGDMAEFVSADFGKTTCVRHSSGTICHWHYGEPRTASTVRILDWPSWCGPRPDDGITLKQAAERIGRDGVVAVVVDRGDGHIETYDESDRNEFRGQIALDHANVLGFVVAEDE